MLNWWNYGKLTAGVALRNGTGVAEEFMGREGDLFHL
jgi:hypothetical protein